MMCQVRSKEDELNRTVAGYAHIASLKSSSSLDIIAHSPGNDTFTNLSLSPYPGTMEVQGELRTEISMAITSVTTSRLRAGRFNACIFYEASLVDGTIPPQRLDRRRSQIRCVGRESARIWRNAGWMRVGTRW
jgi:hypothetical protein